MSAPESPGTPAPAARELAFVLDRDLAALGDRIRSYENEDDLWRTSGSIRNSAGTLAVHLAGNLSHFVGAVLGGTGYVRDRDAEFSGTRVPRTEILRRVEEARGAVRVALEGVGREAMDAPFPARAPASLGPAPTTRLMLIHLATHLGYHLGQVDYHRRILGCGGA